MNTSNSVHFIVTRPINRATNLVERLKKISTKDQPLQIDHCPLITIADYSEEIVPNFSAFNGVIFISGNAVDQAKKQLHSPDWEKLLQNPLYAIGQQTAAILQSDVDQLSNNKALAERQIVNFPQQMNSEGLLLMPQLKNIAGQSWLIVKGLGGRDKLKNGLEAAGAMVSELAVYQRKLPDLMAQRQIASYNQHNPYWLVTSLQALNNLWRIVEKKPNDCRIIVSSDRIASEAVKIGFNVVAQSFDATDQQLVKCVKYFIRNKQL